MTERQPLTITVDPELGDQIITEWLVRHIEYASDNYDKAIQADDKVDAANDWLALRRIYQYVTGKEAP